MGEININDTPHILKPEIRYHVDAMVAAVVCASDDDEALEQVQEGNWLQWFTPQWEAKRAEYDGAWLPERWRAACAACWFGGGRHGEACDVRKLAVQFEGQPNWWATDNHIMLRCDGPTDGIELQPQDRTVWKKVVRETATRRQVTGWLPFVGYRGVDMARAEPGGFTVQTKYLLLAEAIGIDRWEVGDKPEVPALGFRNNQLEVVIMGLKPSADDRPRSTAEAEVFQRRLEAVREAARKRAPVDARPLTDVGGDGQ